MKVKKSTVEKVEILDVKGMDTISVFLEDYAKGVGEIIIKCWDKTWHSYWGGMGSMTISEFFLSCDNGYLAKNLSSINPCIVDFEEIAERIKSFYGEDWQEKLGHNGIDELSGSQSDGEFWVNSNYAVMSDVFGYDWYFDLPKKENPEYIYLCKIINTIKEALKGLK